MQSLLGTVSDLLLPSFECEEFRNSLTMPMLNCLWEDYYYFFDIPSYNWC